jgi:hypothetical protein
MERNSNEHGPRVDDEMAKEVASLMHGAPVEARVDENRLQEDGADGEPVPSAIILEEDPIRDRSELARHLRPSIFPADREQLVQCAIEEHAPDDMVDALRALPVDIYATTNDVWVALGHETEQLVAEPETESVQGRRVEHLEEPADETENAAPVAEPREAARPEYQRFTFRFDWRYRIAALPFGVIPSRAYVEIDASGIEPVLHAQFGWWSLQTPVANIASVQRSGPYALPKTIGPAHLSFTDQGITFATTNAEGLCLEFREPVTAIEPLGLVQHPGLTVTVDDLDGLEAALSSRGG